MMNTAPSVPHLPVPILELILNQQIKDLTALGQILAAMRPSSRLAEIISAAHTWTTTPTFEVADYLSTPEPLLYHCKHGSQPAYVPPRLVGPLIRGDNGTQIWTPEHGVTFYGRPCLYKEFALRPVRKEWNEWNKAMVPCAYDPRLDDRDDLEPAVDESFDCSHPPLRFRTSTAVIIPQKPVCYQCDSEEHKVQCDCCEEHQQLANDSFQFQQWEPLVYRVVCNGALPTAVATIESEGIRAAYNFEKNSSIYRKPAPWLNRSSNGVVRPGEMPRLLKHYCPDCTVMTVGSFDCCTITIGAYLPIEHKCPRVRVYNSDGVLLETTTTEASTVTRDKSFLRPKQPSKNETREIAARKRLETEMRMVASRHPHAPYEARSLKKILDKSRTFPS